MCVECQNVLFACLADFGRPFLQATLQAQLRAQEVDTESLRQLAAWQATGQG